MYFQPIYIAGAALALGFSNPPLPVTPSHDLADRPAFGRSPSIPVVGWEPNSAAVKGLGGTTPVAADEPRSAPARTVAALGALSRQVVEQSHPEALTRAFHAFYTYQAAHPERVRKPYLYYVDYGLDYRTPRGYVFDMEKLRVVEGPFTVAHGRGSAPGAAAVPTRFSNIKDSNASSLGLYLAQETYAFRGRSGGRRYSSVGLRMQGLSGAFNDAARRRGIVAHGAPYVTAARAGRSEGCPAMEEKRAQRLLPRISNGGLVFLFSPHDPKWLREDPWSREAVALAAAAE